MIKPDNTIEKPAIQKFETILEEARAITSHDREDQYGPAENSFNLIGYYWNVFLNQKICDCRAKINEAGIDLSSSDVAQMMILMKLARERHRHKRDNCVDIAGYARLLSKIEGDEK